MNELFRKISHGVSIQMGSPWAFAAAMLIIVAWAASGPLFDFSDTWQLVINTGTTILTFLMVFVIQNTQNRDAAAMHLKLDELIRSARSARNTLIDSEDMSEEDLIAFQKEFKSFHDIRRAKRHRNSEEQHT